MTFMPNPGCEIPQIKVPPSIEDFFTSLAVKQAALLTANPTVLAAKKLADQATKKQKELQAYIDSAVKYIALLDLYRNISCPLPDIVDKTATMVPRI